MKQLVFILLPLLFIACSENGNSLINEPEPVENQDTFLVHIKYKGKDLYSKCTEKNGQNLYCNPELVTVLDEVEKNSNAVSVVYPDGCVEFFTDEAQMQKKCNFRMIRKGEAIPANIKKAITLTRGTPIADAGIYDDDNYHDTNYYMSLTSLYSLQEFAVLDYDYENRKIGLNDKITSIIINYNLQNSELCAIMVVWEDARFNFGDNDRTKHRTYFIAHSQNRNAGYPDLKRIPCFNSRDSWNDRISSLSFHIGYMNSFPSSY